MNFLKARKRSKNMQPFQTSTMPNKLGSNFANPLLKILQIDLHVRLLSLISPAIGKCKANFRLLTPVTVNTAPFCPNIELLFFDFFVILPPIAQKLR